MLLLPSIDLSCATAHTGLVERDDAPTNPTHRTAQQPREQIYLYTVQLRAISSWIGFIRCARVILFRCCHVSLNSISYFHEQFSYREIEIHCYYWLDIFYKEIEQSSTLGLLIGIESLFRIKRFRLLLQ